MSRAPWLWCPVSFDLDSPLRSGFGLTVCVLTCFMTVGLSRISVVVHLYLCMLLSMLCMYVSMA